MRAPCQLGALEWAIMTANPDASAWLGSAPDLSASSALPVHTRLEQWIGELIDRGVLRVGDRLPPEEELAPRLGVSRMTLRHALATLQSSGVVTRRTGRSGGTFITERTIDCDLTGLAGFTAQMRRANLRAGARKVSAATIAAPRDAAAALGLERGAPVHEIVRIRTANRQPLALEHSYLPAALFPSLIDRRLAGSIYALLAREYALAPQTAEETLVPVVAGSPESGLLEVAQGTPLLLIERTAYTASGRAVEFARDLFRPDRIRVSLRTGIS